MSELFECWTRLLVWICFVYVPNAGCQEWKREGKDEEIKIAVANQVGYCFLSLVEND